MTWRPALSLSVLRNQLQAGAPRAVPPATRADEWGLIGDAAHDPTSDHSPHNFLGWGQQIVTAADFPNRPDLGLDAHRVLDDIRRSRDPRAKYGISNGQIFSNHAVSEHGHNYAAWEWRPYSGSDGHYTHGHLSVVGDARADGAHPWQTIGNRAVAGTTSTKDEDDMGASFGPIEIQPEGVITSLTIPPVHAGQADPRDAWLNFCNDTGQAYGLRIWVSTGNKNFSPMPGTDGGQLVLVSGQRWSQQLPTGTACVSILRQPVNKITYAGHLTCAIERGPVVSAAE
jgi:hypothetical protein